MRGRRRVHRVGNGQDVTATSEVNADPEPCGGEAVDSPGSRVCRSAGELGDDGGAVDPHLLSTDEAVVEVEHVEDAEGDPAIVAGDAEHLSDHGSGHRLFEDHRVAGEVAVQWLLVLGAEVGREEPVELGAAALPVRGEPGNPTASCSMSSV